MIKVTMARSYAGDKWWKVNKKAKGSFTREFKDLSELAKFIHSTKRVWFPKLYEELTNRQWTSLWNKIHALEGRLRFIPTFPDEEMATRNY